MLSLLSALCSLPLPTVAHHAMVSSLDNIQNHSEHSTSPCPRLIPDVMPSPVLCILRQLENIPQSFSKHSTKTAPCCSPTDASYNTTLLQPGHEFVTAYHPFCHPTVLHTVLHLLTHGTKLVPKHEEQNQSGNPPILPISKLTT